MKNVEKISITKYKDEDYWVTFHYGDNISNLKSPEDEKFVLKCTPHQADTGLDACMTWIEGIAENALGADLWLVLPDAMELNVRGYWIKQ